MKSIEVKVKLEDCVADSIVEVDFDSIKRINKVKRVLDKLKSDIEVDDDAMGGKAISIYLDNGIELDISCFNNGTNCFTIADGDKVLVTGNFKLN